MTPEPEWLRNLEAEIAAEDREDRRDEGRRRRLGLPAPGPKVTTFEGFSGSAVEAAPASEEKWLFSEP